MWYWFCQGDPNSCSFICKDEAHSNYFIAKIIITWRNLNRKDYEDKWFIRKDTEHPNRHYKQYQCPECGYLSSKDEIDNTWDWAGPHCPNCGCTGMTMFSAVSIFKPVESGRRILSVLEEALKRKWNRKI